MDMREMERAELGRPVKMPKKANKPSGGSSGYLAFIIFIVAMCAFAGCKDKIGETYQTKPSGYIQATKDEVPSEVFQAKQSLNIAGTGKPEYLVKLMLEEYRDMGGKHPYVPYAIISYESQWNPNCNQVTSSEDSRGLFQVNQKAHKLPADQANRLYDPQFNMRYQMPAIINAEAKGINRNLTGYDLVMYVVEEAQRPQLSNPNVRNYIDKTVTRALMEYEANLVGGALK